MRTQQDYQRLKSIGARVKKYRKDAKLSQGWVAEQLGISQNNYGKFENGRLGLRVELMSKLAALFDVDMNVIFTGKAYIAREDSLVDLSCIPEGKRDRLKTAIEELVSIAAEE